jgi:NAD(P)-dependent dehydrogenase (short-subunit alcohol dehydrogenase family)
LNEHQDAKETERWVKQAGRQAVLVPGDIQGPGHSRTIVEKAREEFGGIDVLVNNAVHQASLSRSKIFQTRNGSLLSR